MDGERMSKYKDLAKMLKESNTSHKMSLNNNIFTCYYCPSQGHELCGHQDKCILDETVQAVLVEIKRTVNQIKKFREQKNQEELNRLIIKRKRLFTKYYSLQTSKGGF